MASRRLRVGAGVNPGLRADLYAGCVGVVEFGFDVECHQIAYAHCGAGGGDAQAHTEVGAEDCAFRRKADASPTTRPKGRLSTILCS